MSEALQVQKPTIGTKCLFVIRALLDCDFDTSLSIGSYADVRVFL
jgi:hypothetical protein